MPSWQISKWECDMEPSDQPALVEQLTRTITDEAIKAMGTSPASLPGKALARLVRPVAYRFARLMATFDQDVGQLGTAKAARNILPRFVEGCRQFGAGQIPSTGPLLVASNHPGAMDAMVILAALPRTDVKFIVSDVPFLHALPHSREHLAYAALDMGERLGAIREMIQHLRNGGTVIIYPGGHLDPDPALMPGGAAERLNGWSRSVALLLRHAPETRFVATIASGVLEPRFLSHPLTRLAPEGWERQKLAEILQIAPQLLFQTRYSVNPRVTFGEPVTIATLRDQSAQQDLQQAIVAHARQVLTVHLASEDLASEIPIPTRQRR